MSWDKGSTVYRTCLVNRHFKQCFGAFVKFDLKVSVAIASIITNYRWFWCTISKNLALAPALCLSPVNALHELNKKDEPQNEVVEKISVHAISVWDSIVRGLHMCLCVAWHGTAEKSEILLTICCAAHCLQMKLERLFLLVFMYVWNEREEKKKHAREKKPKRKEENELRCGPMWDRLPNDDC